MSYKNFGDDVFGLNDTNRSDVAEQVVQEDYEQNTVGIYEETAVAQDKRRYDFTEYAVGQSTKRKTKKSYNRSGNVLMENGGGHRDFNEKNNKYYEDVHTNRIRIQAEQDALTEKQKSKLKGGLQKLVDNRSKSSVKKKMKSCSDRAFEGETLGDFLARVNSEDGQDEDSVVSGKRKNDVNDYDWVLSDKRNRREFQVSHGTNGNEKPRAIEESNEEYIVTKVIIQSNDDEWLEKHKRADDGDKPKSSESEVPIQISRKEIHHMQQLTKKLYGREITQDDYVESVKQKLIGENKKSQKRNDEPQDMVEQDMDEWELENYNPQEDDGEDAGEHVDTYTQEWQKAIDAESRKNMAPDVEWHRTVYGKIQEEKCMSLNPYLFITTQSSIDSLIDDTGIHTALECCMRRLKFNMSKDERTFDSIKKWAKIIDHCDVVFSKCKFYTCRIKMESKNKYKNMSDLKNLDAKFTEEKRLVLYHDMKNGFFICNHFTLLQKEKEEVQKEEKRIFADDYLTKKEDLTSQKNYKYRWMSYCYFQYVNTF